MLKIKPSYESSMLSRKTPTENPPKLSNMGTMEKISVLFNPKPLLIKMASVPNSCGSCSDMTAIPIPRPLTTLSCKVVNMPVLWEKNTYRKGGTDRHSVDEVIH